MDIAQPQRIIMIIDFFSGNSLVSELLQLSAIGNILILLYLLVAS